MKCRRVSSRTEYLTRSSGDSPSTLLKPAHHPWSAPGVSAWRDESAHPRSAATRSSSERAVSYADCKPLGLGEPRSCVGALRDDRFARETRARAHRPFGWSARSAILEASSKAPSASAISASARSTAAGGDAAATLTFVANAASVPVWPERIRGMYASSRAVSTRSSRPNLKISSNARSERSRGRTLRLPRTPLPWFPARI